MHAAKNLYYWVIKGKDFWRVIITLFLTIFLLVFLPRYQQWGLSIVRLFGIWNELWGLWIVFSSLSAENAKYRFNGYFSQLSQWAISIKDIFAKRDGVVFSITGVSTKAIVGEGIAQGNNLPVTTEDQIIYLLSEIRRIELATRKADDDLRSNMQGLERKIEKISNQTETSLNDIELRIKEKATVEYNLLSSGLLLTALGVLLTNIPDKIFALFGFNVN